MCTPVLALATVGVVGGVIQGSAAASAATTRAGNYETQSQLEERQADLERESGEYSADRLAERVERVLGEQRAQYAAGGIALTGSAADVITESAMEGAMDVEMIRWNSELRASNLEVESKVSRANARAASASTGAAFLAPVINSVARFGGAFGG